MINSGLIGMPLHFGKVPGFLTERMGNMGEAIVESILLNYGKSDGLKRLHKAAVSGENKGLPLDFINELIDFEWDHAENSGGKTCMGSVVKGLTRKLMDTQNGVLYGRGSD